jgi:hypothetical protein
MSGTDSLLNRAEGRNAGVAEWPVIRMPQMQKPPGIEARGLFVLVAGAGFEPATFRL